MNNKAKITLIYAAAIILSAGILFAAFRARDYLMGFEKERPIAVNVGAEKAQEFFTIENDLTAQNQIGKEVKLSELKGKVILLCEFFAVCPHCAMRNGAELRGVVEAFGNDPNFHIVCVSIDPQTDNITKLNEYATTLNADVKNWWFLRAKDNATAHEYMEKTMKFIKVVERINPLEIESNGRYAHDLSFALINPDFKVVGKWNLAGMRSENHEKYEEMKKEMMERIKKELEKK